MGSTASAGNDGKFVLQQYRVKMEMTGNEKGSGEFSKSTAFKEEVIKKGH